MIFASNKIKSTLSIVPPEESPGVIRYRRADRGVENLGGKHLIISSEGGRIRVDSALVELLKAARGSSFEDLLNEFGAGRIKPLELRAALACLAEAGLLEREGWNLENANQQISGVSPAPVSVVVVNFDSQEWLAECLPSVLGQTFRPEDVVVVDNASRLDPADWLQAHYPGVQMLRLAQMQSLAAAINRGVEQTRGEFILILNPDVRLEPRAVAEMLAVAAADPDCAVVAPKLKFWWAPAFLNGIGNQPGFFRWGSDNGIGHLDLGQFDDWEEVPSACFAAALIRRSAWDAVGPCDSGFRFYYEDAEWSYRARLMGWRVRAAPNAVVYHALGRRVHTGQETDFTPAKLRSVVYGRLRFTVLIMTGSHLLRRLGAAVIHDTGRALLLLFRGDWRGSAAILRGWSDFFESLSEIRSARQKIQNRRVRTGVEIFSPDKHFPSPLIWRGLPRLTWDEVRRHYLPVIQAGKTRPLPEFESWFDASNTKEESGDHQQ